MSIMELGALGEFVAALAVLITLIFLTVQVRYARQESARALMQSRTENGTHIGMGIATSESLAAAHTRVSEALSEQPSRFVDALMQKEDECQRGLTAIPMAPDLRCPLA